MSRAIQRCLEIATAARLMTSMLRFAKPLCVLLPLALAQATPAWSQETPAPPSAANPFQAPTRSDLPPRMTGTPVRLAALLTKDGTEISSGMVWRVFKPEVGDNGKLPLVASKEGGVGEFQLPPGSYLIHAAYGRAGATKRITVGQASQREDIVLDAGGLELNALLAGGKEIPPAKLRFSVYEAGADSTGNRSLIVPDVKPNTIVRLNSGLYHVVSTYGSANAVVRSDIRVEAGKLTEAKVEHKAAEITLKLVREAGGEALAETAWSLVNDSGDPILETVGPYAAFVLAEGNYVVVAKNRDRIFQQEIIVESGQNREIDVLANDQSEIDPNEGAD